MEQLHILRCAFSANAKISFVSKLVCVAYTLKRLIGKPTSPWLHYTWCTTTAACQDRRKMNCQDRWSVHIQRRDDDSFAEQIPVGWVLSFSLLFWSKHEFRKRFLEWEYDGDQTNLGTLCILYEVVWYSNKNEIESELKDINRFFPRFPPLWDVCL